MMNSNVKTSITATNNLQPKQTRTGVGVIIIRHDNEVLMGERKGAHGSATFAFPGGHLEKGEDIFQCAIREVFEETNLNISHLTLGPTTHDFFEESNIEYLTHFVITQYNGGIPMVKEPAKCLGWEWVAWKDLPKQTDKLFKPIRSLLDLRIQLADLINNPR